MAAEERSTDRAAADAAGGMGRERTAAAAAADADADADADAPAVASGEGGYSGEAGGPPASTHRPGGAPAKPLELRLLVRP